MKTITITQPTRQIARNTVKQLKLAGKDAKLVDNGSHLKANQRWNVLVKGRETLTAPRKGSTNTIAPLTVGKREKAVKAYQWLAKQSRKSVDVFVKRGVNVIV